MFRTTRVPAALAVVLVALVLGLLVCGAAGASAPAPMTAGAEPAAGAATPVDAPSVVRAGPSGPLSGVPGCDPGHAAGEGAAGPVVPPRAHGFAELLPALAADRTPCGVRQPGPGDPAASPGREPPARAPLSPVELSVLRV
ncbi:MULTISPECIES: hypothetical protein [unclassified Streptomyces]|uniref:hypothetical protein n=1 Tax=unclassified Streptomyces TaxID=2593676 RepID=UPI0006F3C792|nr:MULTISPECIES: hypothetical protein [unclassified Streptomyces]KQX49318.1 hypothetical protein ASD33_16220 [Streptomyces sp. Root1304]KRA78936.1 hypothetical protein ASE09_20740 [Streptomyces sp. Root66D1]